MATIRKREGKKGVSYSIRVSCGYDVTGKQVMRTMTWRPSPGMTERQIQRELKRVVAEFEREDVATTGTIKFQAFAERWFKDVAEKTMRPVSLSDFRYLAKRTYQAIGHIRMDKLSAYHIQQFINQLCEEGMNKRSGKKLSPATIKAYFAFVSTVLSYAVKIGVIENNPCKRVTLPRMEKKEKDIYTIEEAKHFLDSLQDAPILWRTFFTLAIYTGFRRGELIGLQWEDICLETGVISIKKTAQYTTETGQIRGEPKTRKSQRKVTVPEEITALLKQWRAYQSKQRLALGSTWKAGSIVFTTEEGKGVGMSTPYGWLQKFCNRTNQRCLGLHAFRHLYASLLVAGGANVAAVSALLGHSNTTTTLNTYTHNFDKTGALEADAISNALKEAK